MIQNDREARLRLLIQSPNQEPAQKGLPLVQAYLSETGFSFFSVAKEQFARLTSALRSDKNYAVELS